MIKATGKQANGRNVLFIGLSFANLERFRESPMNTFIPINGVEIGLPFDVIVFSGKTEKEMADFAPFKSGAAQSSKKGDSQ
jgi:hypothetical protein